MEVKTEIPDSNPWDVTTIEDFLQYCCPECDTKSKDSSTFISHALEHHELARSYLSQCDQIVCDEEDIKPDITYFTPEIKPEIELKEDEDPLEEKPSKFKCEMCDFSCSKNQTIRISLTRRSPNCSRGQNIQM